MTNIIIHGINGHMGQIVLDIATKDPEINVVAGVDPFGEGNYDFPLFASMKECNVDADVVVDFSNAAAVNELLKVCENRSLPVVLCTTGLSDETISHIKKAIKKTAVLRSANMSLGINILIETLKQVSKKFCESGYDVEIVEAHHNRKLDAPSGTALALADAVKEGSGHQYTYTYDRSDRRQKRDPNEIGISAIRGGNIAGIHDVMFCGEEEVITFKHEALSRGVFARGAIEAAKFLKNQQPGLYDMSDVIAAK